MKKEIKIEDFISKKELDAMSDKEREIYEKVFLLNKEKLQNLTDALKILKNKNDL